MRGQAAFMAYFDRPRPMGRNEHTLDSPLDPSGHFFLYVEKIRCIIPLDNLD